MIPAWRGMCLFFVFLCRCHGDLEGITVVGLVTSESVIVATPSALTGGNIKMKGNNDGILVLGEPSCYSNFKNKGGNILVALCGEHSYCDSLITDLVAVCDAHLESYDLSLSTDSVMQYYRKILYEDFSRLRQHKMDVLIGGKTSHPKKVNLHL